MDATILVRPDAAAVACEAARRFARLAKEAVRSRGSFSTAVSGGSTPETLYRLLAEEPYRSQIPWPKVHVFWADERCVPPQDPASNYRLAHEALLSRVPIPAGNIHRVPGELEGRAAAHAYAAALGDHFGGPRTRFDLILLGLGRDGHTASLFPGSDALLETEQPVAAVEAHYEGRPACRVTLSLPAINTARRVLFLVTGGAKAEIVRAVLEGPPRALPAQRIRPVAGKLIWLLDAEAARLLGSAPASEVSATSEVYF